MRTIQKRFSFFLSSKIQVRGMRATAQKGIEIEEGKLKVQLQALKRVLNVPENTSFTPKQVAELKSASDFVVAGTRFSTPNKPYLHLPTQLMTCGVIEKQVNMIISHFYEINRDPSSILHQRHTIGENGGGPLNFYSPDGLAYDILRNVLYIVDQRNARVQILSQDLQYIQQFNGLDHKIGPLSEPRGIAVSHDGFVAIVDCNNSRVVVLDPDLQPYKIFGKSGSKIGEFRQPRHATFDLEGNLYITDRENNRVQKFNRDGQHLLSINMPKTSTNGTKLERPYSIMTSEKNEIMVLGMDGSNVYVYSTEGDLIESILIQPVAGNANFLSRGPNGSFVVTDFGANSVKIYSRKGEVLRALTVNGAEAAIFLPNGSLVVSNWNSNLIHIF
eukprot:TRINITY_DN5537_c0_g1_i4.p1 TRINITY_DN5537_c0_g1~~TRINITY_DN5537_c0_g1_i4.p1  ORF type:complete len:388 (+),score=60.23 TRINITY_DN5537_c0_g1_i4:525-1688(+)